MKGPEKTVMAVRMKDGSIDVSPMNMKSAKDKSVFYKIPIIRGVLNFIESMVTGYKAMMESAEKSGYLDEIEEEDKKSGEKKDNGKLMAGIMIVATVLAVVLCIGLFIYLPSLLFSGIEMLVGEAISPYRALFEGVLKIAIFLGYMAAVSLMKDIKRVFSYHGAEHKTIFCYEAGEELTVENVRKQRRFHPRCGTSFLILMLIVSIFVTLLLDFFFPQFKQYLLLRALIKLLLVPLICGIGYELIKVCGRHDNLLTKIISAPGLWLQRITVKEPDDSMIEIAIAAMKEVIPENSEADNW